MGGKERGRRRKKKTEEILVPKSLESDTESDKDDESLLTLNWLNLLRSCCLH